ncbi:DUF4387 domain-containing protein [Desulfovibrio sp. OttesenSCG-928-O18]|nr:DUF4387 domain-containing protein [Desulfovibrio sp. OttesenSCG-928-O18]
MPPISEIAEVCKSKNAGPFDLTVDIVLPDRETYNKVLATGVVCAELFARLYNVAVEDVLFTPYPAANAFKATFPRLVSGGDIGDTDCYGAQQHAPLLNVDIPI